MKNKEKNISQWSLLWRVLNEAKLIKWVIITAITLTVILAFLSPLRPFLIEKAIDNHASKNDLLGLKQISILILFLIILNAIIQFFNEYLSSWIAQHVIKNLRLKVFNHVLNKRLTYFDQTPIGTLTTRTVTDIETVSELFAEGIITIIGDILQIIVIASFMFYMDFKLTLIAFSVLPLLFYASHLFRIKVKSAFEKVRTAVSNLNAYVQEQLTGIQIIQIFNQEEKSLNNFKKINQQHYQSNHQSVMYYSVFFPVLEIITSISIALIIYFSVFQSSVENPIKFSVITAFILYINMFFRPIRFLADRFNNIQMGLVAAERIFKLLDNEELSEDKNGRKTFELTGNIKFKNIEFSYINEQEVLKDVSFEIRSGEKLAIIGPTGSGKSSIINLITGLYPLNRGEIEIDGISIKNIDQDFLRSQITVVNQDIFLFGGSIYDNLTLFNPNISKSDVENLINHLQVTDFIEQLPNGLEYKVMERGNTLSTGQRQIISILRALIQNPKIVILDEATSSVDKATELILQKSIDELLKNRTGIVIAHRLSTIEKADKILFLEKGKIIEYGTKDELLKLKGKYFEWIN